MFFSQSGSYLGLFDCGDSLGFPVWSKGRFDDSIDVRTSNDIRLSTIKLVLCRKTTQTSDASTRYSVSRICKKPLPFLRFHA
jgi:hypothetical protein